MKTIYIGWDKREEVAADVARRSIQRRTASDIIIKSLRLDDLKDILTRPIEYKNGRMWCPISQAPMATEFAISRFAVPILQKTGWALFVDCDIVCLSDIDELFALADPQFAVQVVQHNYKPNESVKMDNQVQTTYARKNWSSVILWNCDHPANKGLSVVELNTWPGRDLHGFRWLDDKEIGPLPIKWNYLIGVYPTPHHHAGIFHFTLGGPWIKDWKGGPCDDIWLEEARHA